MPNGNFKKILATSLCYDDDFYKFKMLQQNIFISECEESS